MAYLSPDFDFDIFISYTHANNAKGWVSRLHTELEIKLSGFISGVKIWRDPELSGNTLFDEKIQKSINRSALFLAVTSERYLSSKYCRDELQWFYQKACEESWGLSVESESRIFNLRIHDIPPEEWPEEFKGISGNKFFGKDGFEFDQSSGDFEDELKKLARSVHQILKAFRIRLQERKVPPVAQPARGAENEDEEFEGDAPSVFLAASSGLKARREQILTELRDKRVKVVTRIPPPRDSRGHDDRVREVMKKVDLSIHLLSEEMGDEIDDNPDKSYSQRQVELGLEHAKSQVIWLPPSLDIQSQEIYEPHRQFLKRIEEMERPASCRIIRDKPSDLPRVLIETVEEIRKARETAPIPSVLGALLNTHAKDQAHALELYKFLLNKSVQPFLEPELGDPEQTARILAERMKQVSRLIIVYGSVDRDWVITRLGQATQLSITQNCPIKVFGIYLAPPRSKARDGNFKFPSYLPVFTFDQHDIDDTQALKPLLEVA